MTNQDYLNNIREKLALLAIEVSLSKSSNMSIDFTTIERFCGEFFNVLFEWNLTYNRANDISPDYTDYEHRILFEITGNNSRAKIQSILDRFARDEYLGFHLIIFVLANKRVSVRQPFAVPYGIEFDWDNDVLDIERVIRLVSSCGNILTIKELSEICDRYFEAGRNQRHEDYQMSNSPQMGLKFSSPTATIALKEIRPFKVEKAEPPKGDEIDPEKTPILFSICTKKAFEINSDFYKGLHYVWCAPFFTDPNQPPTSNPLTIYNTLEDIIFHKDIHATEIENNKAGLLRGVQSREKEGIITSKEREFIEFDINRDQKKENYYPVIYVIPVQTLADYKKRCKKQAKEDCASANSIEYKITDLKADEFYLIDLSDSLKRKIK